MRIGNWEINKIVDRVTVPELLLAIIGTVGVVSLAVVAGNAVQLLKKKKKYYRPAYINSRLETLVKKGLLKKELVDGEKKLSITIKGEKAFLAFRHRQDEERGKLKWDGLWRIVIFDIKERRRKIRDELRMELIGLGFKHLQNSVWITPYDCSEYVEIVKTELDSNYDVIFLTAKSIDQEAKIKDWFNLE